jgi:hypothetical protein
LKVEFLRRYRHIVIITYHSGFIFNDGKVVIRVPEANGPHKVGDCEARGVEENQSHVVVPSQGFVVVGVHDQTRGLETGYHKIGPVLLKNSRFPPESDGA